MTSPPTPRGLRAPGRSVPTERRARESTDFSTPTISRLAALVVVDVLATAVALRRTLEHIERLRAMKEQLTAMRTGGIERQDGRRHGRRHG